MENGSLFMVVRLNNNEEPSTSKALEVLSKQVPEGTDLEGNIVDFECLNDIGELVDLDEGNEVIIYRQTGLLCFSF